MKDVGELPEAAVKSEFGDRCCSVKIFGYPGFCFEMLYSNNNYILDAVCAQYIHAYAIEREGEGERGRRRAVSETD